MASGGRGGHAHQLNSSAAPLLRGPVATWVTGRLPFLPTAPLHAAPTWLVLWHPVSGSLASISTDAAQSLPFQVSEEHSAPSPGSRHGVPRPPKIQAPGPPKLQAPAKIQGVGQEGSGRGGVSASTGVLRVGPGAVGAGLTAAGPQPPCPSRAHLPPLVLSPQMDHDPRKPAYIATQGPLPSTVADFWQVTLSKLNFVLSLTA